MNQLIVNSRKFFREFRNGANFATDTSVFSTFFKALTMGRMKFVTNVTIKSFVLSSVAEPILVTQGTGEVFFTHPNTSFNWGQSFKIGDTISIRKSPYAGGETVTNIAGNVLTTTDTIPVIAGLGLADNTSYTDLNFYNTMQPTSLVYQYGIVPNILPPPSLTTSGPNFLSWLDGQAQAYYADGITGSLTGLTSTMQPNAELTESVESAYVSTTDDYIFNFDLEHIFRVDFYVAGWLTDLINQTFPFAFTLPASWRYICQYKFGTSSSDPNENRVFTDQALNGALGFVGQNYTNGTGVYGVLSIAYEDPDAIALPSIEATVVNTITLQLEHLSSNFPAGQKIILYVSKLPAESEYTTSLTPWVTTHVFDQVTAEDGGLLVDGDFIKDVFVEVNADPTKLDILFDIDFSTDQKAAINMGDRYLIAVEVGDVTLTAELSDAKVVWCDCNTYTKNTDIDGLIHNHRIGCFTAEKTPTTLGGDNSDFKLWNNRLEEFVALWDLDKIAGTGTSIEKIEAQLVTWDAAGDPQALDVGILDSINLPLFTGFGPTGVLNISTGIFYQVVSVTGYRDFDISPSAIAKRYTLKAIPPTVGTDQYWLITFPMIMPDRDDLYNPTIPTVFFDDTKPNNNLNYKTSNYSGVGGFGIYCRLLVTVRRGGIDTIYRIWTEKSIVRDYDTDPPTENWTCTHEILNEAGAVIPYFKFDENCKIRSTFSATGVSGLTTAFLVGEQCLLPKDRTSPGFRLHSSVNWQYSGNALEPIDGENYVQITHDIPGDKVILISQVKAGSLDQTKEWDIVAHLYENR